MCQDRNVVPVIFVSWPKASAARAYAQFKPCINSSKLKFKTEPFFFLKYLEEFHVFSKYIFSQNKFQQTYDLTEIRPSFIKNLSFFKYVSWKNFTNLNFTNFWPQPNQGQVFSGISFFSKHLQQFQQTAGLEKIKDQLKKNQNT